MVEKNTTNFKQSQRIDYEGLRKILPQAHPFILIDRVEEYIKDVSLVAIKNVTGNEWAFGGNSNGIKYFPETLMIEAAAQAALVLYHVSRIRPGQPCPKYFLGRTKAEFFRQVGVGEQLKVKAFATKMMDLIGYSQVEIRSEMGIFANLEVFYSVQK